MLENIPPENSKFDNFELEHNFPVLGHKILHLNARWIFRDNNQTQLIFLAIADVTDLEYANYETAEKLSSNSYTTAFHQGASTGKSAGCPSCGRDLSQPNLLPPSISRLCAKPQGVSRGHGICGECGGLGAGLLDGL